MDSRPSTTVRGHAAGDRAIIELASTLRETCRTTDLAARVGGDEFTVLAPTPTWSARRCSRTASCGACVTRGSASRCRSASALATEEDTPGTLLARADEALYAAKAGGRDRVALATDTDG